MLISGREASQVLAEAGLSRDGARRLLLAGFAGEGVRTRGSLLYEESAVKALLGWPVVQVSAVDPGCLDGTFVARVGPRTAEEDDDAGRGWRGVDLGAPLAEQLDAARMFWKLSALSRVALRFRASRNGFVPFVATVSGYVVLTANIVGVGVHGRLGSVLELEPAGEWAQQFDHHQLVTGPGGPWTLWTGG